jgi:hypothetical protein
LPRAQQRFVKGGASLQCEPVKHRNGFDGACGHVAVSALTQTSPGQQAVVVPVQPGSSVPVPGQDGRVFSMSEPQRFACEPVEPLDPPEEEEPPSALVPPSVPKLGSTV